MNELVDSHQLLVIQKGVVSFNAKAKKEKIWIELFQTS